MQERVFRAHIAASQATGLPLIIHAREADDEIAAILARDSPPPGVLHCFTGGRALAEAALDLGFYISISGIVTFQNAEDLRAIVRDIPLDRLLVETDAPYLAPVPYRGKRNEPAFVAATAAAIAALRGVDPAALAAADHGKFLPPVRARRSTAEHEDHRARLRAVDRRAGDRRRLGRLRSDRPAQPPPPCLAADRKPRQVAADRHVARYARAVARCRASRGSTRSS